MPTIRGPPYRRKKPATNRRRTESDLSIAPNKWMSPELRFFTFDREGSKSGPAQRKADRAFLIKWLKTKGIGIQKDGQLVDKNGKRLTPADLDSMISSSERRIRNRMGSPLD